MPRRFDCRVRRNDATIWKRFPYYWSCDISFVFRLNTLIKYSSYRWFEAPCRSSDVTVMFLGIHSRVNGIGLNVKRRIRMNQIHCNVIWIAYFPLVVDCFEPPAIRHGSVDYHGTTYRSTANYSCIGAYSLVGESSVTCLGNGTWSTLPQCVGKYYWIGICNTFAINAILLLCNTHAVDCGPYW